MNKKKPRVFIGVGHGGPDPGAVNGTYIEADINLQVATVLRRELERHGVTVGMSRTGNEEDRLKEEIAECNAFAPDLAIEIHTNAGGGTGFEVYYQLDNTSTAMESLQLAKRMNEQVQRYLNRPTRGLKKNSSLGWLRQVKAPAILVENFFIDGDHVEWYAKTETLDNLAKAYAKAILDQLGVTMYPIEKSTGLKLRVINADLNTAHVNTVLAILEKGSHYVNLRQILKEFGFGAWYDEAAHEVMVFPSDYYAESDFLGGVVKLSDFPTREERILAGIPIEYINEELVDEDYATDEYIGMREGA